MEKTTATLINGDYFEYVNDVVNCPCCLNGTMILKGSNEENLVFECVKCRTTLTVPYVSLKQEEK